MVSWIQWPIAPWANTLTTKLHFAPLCVGVYYYLLKLSTIKINVYVSMWFFWLGSILGLMVYGSIKMNDSFQPWRSKNYFECIIMDNFLNQQNNIVFNSSLVVFLMFLWVFFQCWFSFSAFQAELDDAVGFCKVTRLLSQSVRFVLLGNIFLVEKLTDLAILYLVY